MGDMGLEITTTGYTSPEMTVCIVFSALVHDLWIFRFNNLFVCPPTLFVCDIQQRTLLCCAQEILTQQRRIRVAKSRSLVSEDPVPQAVCLGVRRGRRLLVARRGQLDVDS